MQNDSLRTAMYNSAVAHSRSIGLLSSLSQDLLLLEKYPTQRFVWLLRPTGTTFAPTRLGINPAYVTQWLTDSHGRSVSAFCVDAGTRKLKRLSHEEAIHLMEAPPADLRTISSVDRLNRTVLEVLARGLETGAWNQPDLPDTHSSNWSGWREYFAETGNELMRAFMADAVKSLKFLCGRAAVPVMEASALTYN